MQRGQAQERLGYLLLPMSSELDVTSTNKIPAILQLLGLTLSLKRREKGKKSKGGKY